MRGRRREHEGYNEDGHVDEPSFCYRLRRGETDQLYHVTQRLIRARLSPGDWRSQGSHETRSVLFDRAMAMLGGDAAYDID